MIQVRVKGHLRKKPHSNKKIRVRGHLMKVHKKKK